MVDGFFAEVAPAPALLQHEESASGSPQLVTRTRKGDPWSMPLRHPRLFSMTRRGTCRRHSFAWEGSNQASPWPHSDGLCLDRAAVEFADTRRFPPTFGRSGKASERRTASKIGKTT
jgi:hypothetical protein